MPFELANQLAGKHLIVQPADLIYNPPESYFYVQDLFIILCGLIYALCYFFYSLRTHRDGAVGGPIEYLGLTMAYEIYFAFATTTTKFELISFLAWILCDVAFWVVAVFSAYRPEQRFKIVARTTGLLAMGLLALQYLCMVFPDDREQVVAFWTGVLLQAPISLGSVYLLLRNKDTKGHSLEIWITRAGGCWLAYGLFWWRYFNIPANWSFVVSPVATFLIGITLLAEAVYPAFYYRVYKLEKAEKHGYTNEKAEKSSSSR